MDRASCLIVSSIARAPAALPPVKGLAIRTAPVNTSQLAILVVARLETRPYASGSSHFLWFGVFSSPLGAHLGNSVSDNVRLQVQWRVPKARVTSETRRLRLGFHGRSLHTIPRTKIDLPERSSPQLSPRSLGRREINSHVHLASVLHSSWCMKICNMS